LENDFSKMTKVIETDVVIVGAGLVGLSAAVAFAKQGKQVTLVDAKPMMHNKSPEWDARIYAISPESEAWLKDLGVWAEVDNSRVCVIDAMDLWHEAKALSLKSSDANLAKLGVIIENQNLMATLWQKVNALEITVITEVNCLKIENSAEAIKLNLYNQKKQDNQQQICAQLLVAADGVNSWVRRQLNIGVQYKDFNQTAIVANFSAQKPHQNSAKQWFASHETFALLPLVGQNVSLVWSLPTERAGELLELSYEKFTLAVEIHSNYALGDLNLIGDVFAFKLSQQTALATIAERVVLMGDAAHQVHPMAGQGVNLGFRDVMELTSLATKLHAMQDLGDDAFLRKYARARKADTLAMNSLTSVLDALFASDNKMLKHFSNWGFRQLNRQGNIKKLLIQQVAA
jgi:ubiquinone biosynthesis UbiH/UbiF/VisC/COQ6 family hydroxylase